MFTKGHTLSRGRRTGRKKLPATVVNEAIAGLKDDLPELFAQLKIKALNGDREAAIYLIDRAIGKPKQATELDIKGGGEIGTGVVIELLKAIALQRREAYLLEEGSQDATK